MEQQLTQYRPKIQSLTVDKYYQPNNKRIQRVLYTVVHYKSITRVVLGQRD